MKRSILTYKTRLLLQTGALFIAVSTASAQTQNETSQLLNQIDQLQKQVQTLSQAVYRGDKNAINALGSVQDSSAIANSEVRMSQIEEEQRRLTGQIEKIGFDVQQLKDRMDRLQADNDQRFQQIERGSTPSASSSSVGSSTSAAPATQTPSSTGTLGTLNTGSAGNNGASEALYEEAFASIRDAQYDQAEVKFSQFLSQYPGHPLSANAQYWLGETYYVRGDYKKAAKTFAQGYQDFPKGAKAADSLLKLGLSLSKLGRKDDACLSLQQLQKEFPSGGPLQNKAAAEIKQLGCS